MHQSPGRPPWLNCEIKKIIESLHDLKNGSLRLSLGRVIDGRIHESERYEVP